METRRKRTQRNRRKSFALEINKKNEIITYAGKTELMNSYGILLNNEKYQEVSDVLHLLGYEIKASDKKALKMRINSILAQSKFRLAQMENNTKGSQHKGGVMDANYFAREKAIVMAYYKMAFSNKDIMAKEYAYIVKSMCDELNRMNAALRK